MSSSTSELQSDANVNVTHEWVLGPEDTPFYTLRWSPASEKPKAYILFIHGFSEHIARYDSLFRRLASAPYYLHITAFDQRGHGRTSHAPLSAESPEVKEWKAQGKAVTIGKSTKRKTGGWAKVLPDIEWFVIREQEYIKQQGGGGKLFLWGFSMGGGQVLAFVTRPQKPPSEETVAFLSGLIAGGPMIRQTTPASVLQLKVGSIAASIGLGNMLIPAPVGWDFLSQNKESNERAKNDPFCEPVGSLRGLADMLNGGASLDSQSAYNHFPSDLPLLVYHGGGDKICDPAAARRFAEGAAAKDKTFKEFPGAYHEVHNELEPTPSELASLVGNWVLTRVDGLGAEERGQSQQSKL
ncbi:Alpha/Beta hydrolase protein [Naematelia encephala]|uniref:Alpha/Beta hydrolase protein n=1 Tax=Naematelia encephala TaxID=71784 RepID=A0A1Y2AFQ6_9TREE|nr:Alpha/Beta hydrolase protein [Naematelia encephala]